MFILGLIATVLSVVGYLIISNIKVTRRVKLGGLYIRLFAAFLFIVYTLINKDYSVLGLTLFYGIIDVYNLRCLLKEK